MHERLYRSRTDRVLFGVAGGFAEWLDVDPSLVRLVWALLVVAGGAGLLLYVIAALVIPEEPWELATAVPTTPEATAGTTAVDPATTPGTADTTPAGTTAAGTATPGTAAAATAGRSRTEARQSRRAARQGPLVRTEMGPGSWFSASSSSRSVGCSWFETSCPRSTIASSGRRS